MFLCLEDLFPSWDVTNIPFFLFQKMVLFTFACLIHLEFIHIPFLWSLCVCLKKCMFAVENLENKIWRGECYYCSQSRTRRVVVAEAGGSQWRAPASSPGQRAPRGSRALCVPWVRPRFLCPCGIAWSHRNQGLFPSFLEASCYTIHLYKQIFVLRIYFCDSLARWVYLNLFEKIFLCYSSEKPCKRH